MKKIISIIMAFVLLTLVIFTGKSLAAPLGTINVETDKTTVRPGENVKVTIEFGQDLGAYTFDINYDNKIFEYVSVEGGTANDTSDKVRVTFYDSTGGTSPRTNMSIIFKAKEDITTSNPTEFTVTGEGLANADASVSYDDITIPIVKNVTVEPEYIDYDINLTNKDELIKEKEVNMILSYSSSMGRYYEHARLIAEATSPSGANVQLLATDESQLEHDIIQSGWGDAQGYKIGGKDVSQVLDVRGIFSHEGDYTITLKLIDRDNSDQVISERTFYFTVAAEQPSTNQSSTTPENGETTDTTEENLNESTNREQETMPSELPKTGINIYFVIGTAIISLIGIFAFIQAKQKR